MNVNTYLSKFYNGTGNPTLKAMEFFMKELGYPEKKMKIIHIAGTNGKGSCTEMISNILIKAGYKIGKFISPHLVEFNERISIQNQKISDDNMEKLIKILDPKINEFKKEYNREVTLFELETTMAILFFYQNNCDFVVLETGLGGLYDCTNIVNPIVSIITSIGFDHMQVLGNTLVEIAEQKAGIIKENSETVFALSEKVEVNNKIREICKQKNNKLHTVNKKNIKNYSYDNNFQRFDYKDFKDIVINLKGEKQLINASVCIECIEILRKKSFNISNRALREGLRTIIHKGRFETINEKPLMIFDGAHNEPAIKNFVNSVKMYYKKQNKVYIISILKRKDYKMILKYLLKDNKSTFIFTDGNDKERYTAKEELLNISKEYTKNKKVYAKELEDSIQLVAKENANDVIFFVGSFYIYGTVTKKIKEI